MLKTLCAKLCQRFRTVKTNDSRSRRFIVVIECILNQNARDGGAATFPALSEPILQLCNEYKVGIVQMPCPEIKFLGFERTRQKGQSIKDALDTSDGRDSCRKISMDIADRIEEYLAQGYQILSILGGNPQSPGCAVHYTGDELSSTSGVLMRELQDELLNRNIHMPFKGIRDYDSNLFAQDIEWLRRLFTNSTVSPND